MLEYCLLDSGKLQHISESKLGHFAKCPFCLQLVVGKKGKIKRHHFAHIKHSCAQSNLELNSAGLAFFNDVSLPSLNDPDLKFFISCISTKKSFNIESDIRLRSAKERFHWQKGLNIAIEKGLVEIKEEPALYAKTAILLAIEGRLTLKDFFVCQEESITQKLHDIKKTSQPSWEALFRHHVYRLTTSSLYFLKLKLASGTCIYKIGITARDIETRLKEIEKELSMLRVSVQSVTVEFLLPGRGGIEQYFKHKYRAYKHPIGSLTEYFHFPSTSLVCSVLSELSRLERFGTNRRIAGTLNQRKQRKVAKRRTESKEDFLSKHKNIVEALSIGLSIRQVAREMKRSVNTVRKVKQLTDNTPH